jgi:tetratricopeptide (TPR) repeat protein
MDRREMLAGLMVTAAAGMGMPVTDSADDAADRWHLAAERLGERYNITPPVNFLRATVADYTGVRRRLAMRVSGDDRSRLILCAGLLAGLVAKSLNDNGAWRMASGWLRHAADLAEELGDPSLLAWLKAEEALVFTNWDQPARAIPAARQAQAIGGPRRYGTAKAAGNEARSWARIGDVEGARRALERAHDLFAQVDEPPRSAYNMGERTLALYSSDVLSRIGDVGAAFEAYDRVVAHYRPRAGFVLGYAALDRASCLIRAGDLEAGCEYAVNELDRIGPAYRSAVVRHHVDDLLNAIPEDRRDSRDARALRELLPA